jgi:hypothetical protein
MPTHRERKKSKCNITTVTRPQPDSPTKDIELHEVNRLLHLIWHRNKNQHRGQKWWKWVGMLRRSIGKLLVFERQGWRRREEEREKECRERWVREIVLPGAWLSVLPSVGSGAEFALVEMQAHWILMMMLMRIPYSVFQSLYLPRRR